MAAHHTSKIRTHSRHTVRRYLAAIPWRCTRSTTSSCGACLSPCVPPSKARRDAGSDPRVASSVSQCALATRARISNLRSCRADNSMLKPKVSLHIESDLLLTSFLCFAARLLAASAAACSRTRAEVDAALKNRNILEAAQSPAQALCTAVCGVDRAVDSKGRTKQKLHESHNHHHRWVGVHMPAVRGRCFHTTPCATRASYRSLVFQHPQDGLTDL